MHSLTLYSNEDGTLRGGITTPTVDGQILPPRTSTPEDLAIVAEWCGASQAEEITTLQEEVVRLQKELGERDAAHGEAMQALRDEQAAKIAGLNAAHRGAMEKVREECALACAEARGEPAPQAEALLGELRSVFGDGVPAEVQASFAGAFATVRVLVLAEEFGLAAAFVQGLEISQELEPVRSALLEKLNPVNQES